MIEWLAFILPGAVVVSGISWATFRGRDIETELHEEGKEDE
ncbi:hypothetical protein SEA_SLEEPYHEAD_62 [Rhodococcus phage Sleepyhead]|uniref:Uncharacterized protein n=1 Tax=Rhodococcus phage Sleepyhead TaxID=2591131 RepID=A0A515MHF2_9CAUD|nr:hypothetical protein HWC38_gp62 [Rhodococcus phage Sleepyhead]QDM56077.1 hypothetical protein SEA_SLEEPYHEAD_62 [Rhodococcus phage Sleepyhead]